MFRFQFLLALLQIALVLGAEISEDNSNPVERQLLQDANSIDKDVSQEGLIEDVIPEVSLEALCLGEDVELYRLSQFSSLMEQLAIDQPDFECDKGTILALQDFQTVIEEDEQHVCTMHKIDLYEQFYYKYLNTRGKSSQSLPSPLWHFVMGYGMQLANACKWNMFKELNGQVMSLLSKDDFDKVAKYIHQNSPMVRLVGATRYPDELFLPADLLGDQLANGQSEWAMSEGAARDNFVNLQKRCERRFKPIYEPLIMPVARLAQMGFNYRDNKLKKVLLDSDIQEDMGKWPRVVFLCELVGSIKLMPLEDTKSNLKEGPIEDENVLYLGEEEANSVSSLDGEVSPSAEADIEPIEYAAQMRTSLRDEIISMNDWNFPVAIVFNFNFLDSKWKRRLRQVKNFMSIMTNHLKHFRIHSIVAQLFRFFWWQQDFWYGVKNKNDEIRQGIERELDLSAYLRKNDDQNLTQTQKRVRFVRKGLYLTFKTAVAAVMTLLTFCFVIC